MRFLAYRDRTTAQVEQFLTSRGVSPLQAKQAIRRLAELRYLDDAAINSGGRAPDFLSHSHGEGFLRFFEERCDRQGVYLFDEPESALSPSRQIEFLKLLNRMEQAGVCQIIIATHAPILMAYPGARLLRRRIEA